jgi:phospholipid/cholesterol/gamma-HCH transport system substrate-binding protein
MENKSHALAAGTFVLLLIALLVALATWLTRDSTERRLYELSSAEAITGLQPQASVRFKGVNVGKVVAIGFDPEVAGNVLIRLSIDSQTPVTSATFAALGFQGVTGLAFVQLDDSGDAKQRLEPSPTGAPTRIPMRQGLMSRLSEQGSSILLQLEESSRRLNQLLAPENQQKLIGAVDQLGQAASSLKLLANQTGHVLPPLVQNANATLQTLKETSLRVGDSADKARDSAQAFKKLTERMNEKDGTLDGLARTTRAVNRIINSVSDNPQAFIYGNGAIGPGPGEPGFAPLVPAKP